MQLSPAVSLGRERGNRSPPTGYSRRPLSGSDHQFWDVVFKLGPKPPNYNIENANTESELALLVCWQRMHLICALGPLELRLPESLEYLRRHAGLGQDRSSQTVLNATSCRDNAQHQPWEPAGPEPSLGKQLI